MLDEMVTTCSRSPEQCRQDVEAVRCVIIAEFPVDEGGQRRQQIDLADEGR